MAAPQVSEVVQKVSDKILLYFDQPLDDSVEFPSTCFSINYGRIPIVSAGYYGTAAIVIVIDRKLTHRDKIEINYQPPEDLATALRAPVSPEASNLVIRRNAIRAFFKVPVKNQIRPDEGAWNGDSNLGISQDVGDPNSPEGGNWGDGFDVCGDGSVIIGGGAGAGSGGNNQDGSSESPTTSTADSETIGEGSTAGSYAKLYAQYPIRTRPNPRTATPDDFVLAYGLREAIQLTNIDDADATQPNTEKLWMAIQDASALIDNYITQAGRSGKLLISSNRRRTALIIARYYLDTVRRREDVKADYEQCIKELDKARTLENAVRPDLPWWLDPCNPNRANGILSHRIPQYYNGVSGKGLDGWWVDSASEEGTDFRQDGENSQTNNNLGNGGTGVGGGDFNPAEPQQPQDEGGLDGNGVTS